jgi:4-hydroxy-tetrahydrodipicolinate synthase
MHFELLPLMRTLFLETNPVPVKAALSMMGFCHDELRLPLLPLSEGLRPRLRQALLDAGCKLAKA